MPIGANAMLQAAQFGDIRILEALLKAGANVESPNPDGETALMLVARTGNVAAAKVLLKHGADVNARENFRGQTALIWAAAESQPEMVKLLVGSHADVNARSVLNTNRRQVTGEPRAQARPPGRHDAAAVCGAPGVPRVRASISPRARRT